MHQVYSRDMDDAGQSLRERKRLRTRALLIETGRRLIEERGYNETTVANIAEAADIGTRTFFGYFDSKEQLLFPESDPRVVSAVEAIRTRASTETPAQVLLRGLDGATFHAEASDPAAQLRLRLMPRVPAIQARALRAQLEAQHQIVAGLRDAFPHLDAVDAAALVGAFIGAVAAVFQELGDTGSVESRTRHVRAAVVKTLDLT
jgi:AcrR family transcriptional regulator